MKLNIRFIALMLYIISFASFAQEDEEPHITENYVQKDPETVFLSFGTFSVFGVGNNAVSKAYKTGGPGLEIDFNWLVLSNFTIGAKIDLFKADVENPELVGAIRSTRITNYSAHIGYYKAFSREINLHTTIGLGEVGYRSKSMDDKFREYGWNIYLQTEANYRFNQSFGIYAKLQLRNDFLDIQTPSGQEDFFNKQTLLIPGFGIRINIHNPNG